jgi:hypothetical protein
MAGAHHLVVITEERQVVTRRGNFLCNLSEIGTSRHDHIITPPYPLRSKRDFFRTFRRRSSRIPCAKSQAVADVQIGARGRLRHHSATAKQ